MRVGGRWIGCWPGLTAMGSPFSVITIGVQHHPRSGGYGVALRSRLDPPLRAPVGPALVARAGRLLRVRVSIGRCSETL
jgi:hypothetical protein